MEHIEPHETHYIQIRDISKPYLKQKIFGPLYRSTIYRAFDRKTLELRYNENKELISFCIWKRYTKSNFILIDKIGVKETLTSQKLGLSLLNEMKDICKNEKRHIRLKVARINTRGINFYLREDFILTNKEEEDLKEKATYTMEWYYDK